MVLALPGAVPHHDHSCGVVQLEPGMFGTVRVELLVRQVPVVQVVHVHPTDFRVRCLALEICTRSDKSPILSTICDYRRHIHTTCGARSRSGWVVSGWVKSGRVRSSQVRSGRIKWSGSGVERRLTFYSIHTVDKRVVHLVTRVYFFLKQICQIPFPSLRLKLFSIGGGREVYPPTFRLSFFVYIKNRLLLIVFHLLANTRNTAVVTRPSA